MTGTTADSRALVAEMWRTFQPLASRRVGVLEAYVRALASRSADEGLPDDDGRDAAARAAHALLGGLGSFGHPEGSRCAAAIVDLLREPVGDVQQLSRTVAELRAVVGP